MKRTIVDRFLVLLIFVSAAQAFAHFRFKRSTTEDQKVVIRQLFQQHQSINRHVIPLEDGTGYTAVTTSNNPELALAIQLHVKQMADLVADGNRTRQWDPADRQFFRNIDDITTITENIVDGVKVTVTGSTSVASASACNHANAISLFVLNGKEEKKKKHDPASPPWMCTMNVTDVY